MGERVRGAGLEFWTRAEEGWTRRREKMALAMRTGVALAAQRIVTAIMERARGEKERTREGDGAGGQERGI